MRAKTVTEAAFPLRRRDGGLPKARRRGCYIRIIGAFLRGEKALSWQSPGGVLTAFELGNAPLFGAFPDRGGVSLAPPRRWLAEGKTKGLLCLCKSNFYNPPASLCSAPSRAVETALGQKTARTMRRFQVRRRSKPHRGFVKEASAHPLHREGRGKSICSLFLSFRAQKNVSARETFFFSIGY